MFDLKKNIAHKRKSGFGIVEVLVSIVVLGFLYVALSRLQIGNHDTFIRLRGRDGAVQVAQEIMDELKAKGVTALPSASDEDPTYPHAVVTRSWERGLGGESTVNYTPTITVTQDMVASSESDFETVQHVYAKEVDVKVEWNFKGSTQSINVSGVVR